MKNISQKFSNAKIKGLSLIEILVTVVILSIGLLGIAATQTLGMGYNHDSYLRSQATMMINELTERMSINLTAVDNNNFVDHPDNIGAINTDYAMGGCGTAPAPLCEAGVVCTPVQLATYDMFRIACGFNAGGNDGVVNIFPNGTLNIACIDSDGGVDADPCTNGSNHQITITWQRANLNINPIASQVQLVVLP
ncbi:MAG: type IV pilus modification protein PilV [Gammaproteobacteria bacterium]